MSFCKCIQNRSARESVADVEVIASSAINQAFARLEKGDVRYRFVIDMSRAG